MSREDPELCHEGIMLDYFNEPTNKTVKYLNATTDSPIAPSYGKKWLNGETCTMYSMYYKHLKSCKIMLPIVRTLDMQNNLLIKQSIMEIFTIWTNNLYRTM